MEPMPSNPCGALEQPDGSVLWRVWAPRARAVELVLFEGDGRRAVPMEPEAHGYFRYSRPGVREGQRYVYRLDGGPERPDPASRWQPDGVHRPSAVLRPSRFSWADRNWKGVPREDLVFYEIHTGAFTPEGTFEALIPRLGTLRELGVTAAEIMPVGQFPGGRDWGYDGVHPYAPQNTYGGPHGLQRLVNACHRAGLAIFLDVVYNHLGPEGNYLGEFGPYFADAYRTVWGAAFNYDHAGSDNVRDFVLNNVRMWIEDYRFDGLRLDAVHAVHDASPRHILRDIKAVADAAAARLGRPATVVAESDLNDVRLLLPPERGGDGLDAQWSDDFHHTVHAYLTGETTGYYADYGQVRHLRKALENTFVLDGAYSKFRDRRHGAPVGGLSGDRFVVSIQNHDQVGNRARGDRLGALLGRPAQRLAASLMLLSPHLPLLFMGEEYGEENPFQFFCSFGDADLINNVREGRRREFSKFAWQGEVPDPQAESTFVASRLSWSWPEGSFHAGLRWLYHDLLAARRAWPALRNFRHRRARLLPEEERGGVLYLVRGAPPGQVLHVFFNLTDRPQGLTRPGGTGDHLLFSSEGSRYAGQRPATDTTGQLLPHECLVFGPAGEEPLG
jgi:maltooligosyltrehalose trehalohydrolase